MTTGDRPRAPRKDAVANRERALTAAAEVFRREGYDVSVERIARAAGINVSTLYRNFPSKSALLLAIGESLMTPLTRACEQVLASDEPDVVGRFLHATADVYRNNRGVVDTLGPGAADAAVRHRLFELAGEIVTPVVERGHQDGSLAAQLDGVDLLIALRMVSTAMSTAINLDRDVQVYIGIIGRGLAAGSFSTGGED